eukprot:tig00020801_g13918.t1
MRRSSWHGWRLSGGPAGRAPGARAARPARLARPQPRPPGTRTTRTCTGTTPCHEGGLRLDQGTLGSLRKMWAVFLDGPEHEVPHFDLYKRFHAVIQRTLKDRYRTSTYTSAFTQLSSAP